MDYDGVMEQKFETHGPVKRALKAGFTNPLINWVLPAGFLRWALRVSKSEMAQASWSDAGGWKSMVLSYREEKPPQIADRFLVKLGAMPTALRNRLKIVTELLTRMIRERSGLSTNVVCLGAGPGMAILNAMQRADHDDCHSYMIDLNPDCFDFGRQLAEEKGLSARVRFIQGDVTHYRELLDATPHIVKMIGIIEYLPDEIVLDIIDAIGKVMPPGGRLVANSLTYRHGTDRFFRRVFDLHMIHRPADRVQEMLATGGLGTEKVFTEPLGVYDVLVCRKK